MTRKLILNYCLTGFLVLSAALEARSQNTGTAAATPEVPKLDVYGFVMTDFGFDFRNNNPDWFDVSRPSRLPAFPNEFGRNGKTYVGARQSRFGVKGSEPTSMGELKTIFEFDLFGVGADAGQTTIRPRHMYGEVGAFGAGQTNSPFMDIDIFPNILEYWGPNGMVFFRNVQVRWMPIRGETRLTFAAERPGSTQDAGVLSDRFELQNVRARFPLPDFSGEFRYGFKGSYVKVSGIYRKVVIDDLLKDDVFNLDDSVNGWGVDLSSNLKFGKNVLRLQYVTGEGIENYMNDAPVDVAAVPNFGNPIKPIRAKPLPIGSMVAYLDLAWSDKWTTAIGYSELAIENTVLQNPDAFHRGQYASVNLLYTPVKNVLYGGEFQWTRRTNFGDPFHANDYRLQFGFKFNFSATILGGVK